MCGYGYMDLFFILLLNPFEPIWLFFCVCACACVFLGVCGFALRAPVCALCSFVRKGVRDTGCRERFYFTLFYSILCYYIIFYFLMEFQFLISICSTSFFPCVLLLSNFNFMFFGRCCCSHSDASLPSPSFSDNGQDGVFGHLGREGMLWAMWTIRAIRG